MPSPVDVVIVTHNSAATIQRCLASLNSPLIGQVVIVDNNSKPPHSPLPTGQAGLSGGNKISLPDKGGSGWVFLPQPNNLGFARAANLGAAKATSPYILFLNPDAILTPNALESAVHYLDTHPEVALAGLALHDETGHPEPNSFGSPVTLTNLLLRHFIKNPFPSQPTSVDWVSGAAFLIRRPVFDQLNGFDTDFFMYWEDVDLCCRAQKAGYLVVLLPPAIAIHQRGASLNDQVKKTTIYDTSADKYFQKHYATTICFLQRWLRRFYRLFSPLAP